LNIFHLDLMSIINFEICVVNQEGYNVETCRKCSDAKFLGLQKTGVRFDSGS
jgi:hypothetical protein